MFDLARTIMSQPNVWGFWLLISMATVGPVGRRCRGLGWERRRVWCAQAATLGFGFAVAVTMGRASDGLTVQWRGCGTSLGWPVVGPEAWLNVALLVPLGLFGALALRRLWPILVIGLVTSATIEALQGLLGSGACQGADLTRNALGALIGALLGMATIWLPDRPIDPAKQLS